MDSTSRSFSDIRMRDDYVAVQIDDGEYIQYRMKTENGANRLFEHEGAPDVFRINNQKGAADDDMQLSERY